MHMLNVADGTPIQHTTTRVNDIRERPDTHRLCNNTCNGPCLEKKKNVHVDKIKNDRLHPRQGAALAVSAPN